MLRSVNLSVQSCYVCIMSGFLARYAKLLSDVSKTISSAVVPLLCVLAYRGSLLQSQDFDGGIGLAEGRESCGEYRQLVATRLCACSREYGN